MPFLRSFTDYYPPKRYDGLVFTQALIQEAADEAGPWTTIDTKTLAPVDIDPANPLARDLTTTLAVSTTGWYRVVWQDAAGIQFPSEAVVFPADGGVQEQLARMVAADLEPTLADEDIDDLLHASRRPDLDGRLPSDASWTPSYDLNWAAAEGWLLKAGRAAAGFNFAEDGQSFQRSQVYAHCIVQEERYRARVMSSLTVGSSVFEPLESSAI